MAGALSHVASPHRRHSRSDYHYHEISSSGKATHIRSFSLSHISRRNRSGEACQSTVIRVSSFVSPVKSFSRKRSFKPYMTKQSAMKAIEGLDVLKQGETSRVERESPVPSPQGTRATGGKVDECSKSLFPDSVVKLCFGINVFIISVYLCNHFGSEVGDQKWSVDNVKTRLGESIFGQDKVVNALTFLLREFASSPCNSVIVFSGGMGTGKSYASSAIFDSFPWNSSKAVEFYDRNSHKNVMSDRYSSANPNLLIIDDIAVSEARNALELVDKLMQFVSKDAKKLIAVLIFRTCDDGEKSDLTKALQKSQVQFMHHLPFDDLSERDIRLCFEAELKRQGKAMQEDALNSLVSKQTKFNYVANCTLGCKQVYHEVSLLPESVEIAT